MEALENADIFYEMQYKEVKIVAKVSVSVIDQPSERKLGCIISFLK